MSFINNRAAKRIRRSINVKDNPLTRMIGGFTGVLPDFLIVGVQKCGTTSLYNYLVRHPLVYPARKKELGYFDRRYGNGIRWYRSQFPSIFRKILFKHILGHASFLTGEASTGYILYPHALRRIAQTLPDVKVILSLRNPVDRAYSHYQHTASIGREKLSFPDALEKEHERIGWALRQLKSDNSFFFFDIALYGYKSIGLYIDQVKMLISHFQKKNVLILQSEMVFENTAEIFKQVLDFLDLPEWYPREFTVYNPRIYQEMEKSVRRELVDFFRPYNEKLYDLLGVNFGWD